MDIKIVKYDESYAAKVADMWNHSRDGWGGANTVDTEESILHRERNSTNIHTFLALEGEKVVGYCGFSEYRDDEGALYIPLLNVRDDYHGKKIGKKLLLTALEEAISLKWPRLDLYTWPGNTKAVPLYKKCGFFWEERDDTTHLMNFMPTVLHTEAVADFFKDANWYDMSTREIEVKPDGRVENDFHYYEYSWEKENQTLRIEFERTGRGIRLIETDDYYIAASVHEHQLVFGDQYEVRYTITNKTGKPLQIDLNGVSNKNIEYSFEKSIDVTDEVEVIGSFYINPIEEEQNSFRTHPTVKTIVKINGKEATFKLGILPKYPAQVTAYFQEDLTFKGNKNTFYLDLMNNFSEKIHFEVELPDSPIMEIQTKQLHLEMNPKERKSIAFQFVVKEFGFYEASLPIKAIKNNGETVEFTRLIGIPLRGIGAKFTGADEEKVQLFNGQYFASLNKKGNTIDIGRKKQDSSIRLMTPKVGKPYSEELAKAKYSNIEFFEEDAMIGAKITYILKALPSIKLHFIIKLYRDGLVVNYYEVENVLDVKTTELIWVNQPIFLGLDKAIIPYKGEVVELTDSIGNSYEYWDDSQVTENWIFSKGAIDPVGICWESPSKVHFDSWYHYFEHELGKIDSRSIQRTSPIVFSIGAFHEVESFRAFANHTSSKKVKHVNHLRVSLENNNPFVQGEKAIVKVTDYKSNHLHGELSVSLPNLEKLVEEKVDREKKKTEWSAELLLGELSPISIVKVNASLDATVQELETLVIQQRDGNIEQVVGDEQGMDVWKLNNGVIEFKAAPEFFPALHSLTYQGHEWLDTSFPTLQPKLWWNPWSGGISSGLAEIRPHSLAKETTKADFANLIDNKGNKWQGIKLSTTIEQNEEFKGLTTHQYFLTLPGVPILCHVSELDQQTGKFFNGKVWQSTAFLKSDEVMENNWVNLQDKTGKWLKLVAGKDENDLSVDRNLIVGSYNRKEHLQLISNVENTMREVYINKTVMLTGAWEKLNVPSNSTQFTKPNFYIFTDTVIDDKAQYDLQEICFK